jgi:hypothetical protein
MSVERSMALATDVDSSSGTAAADAPAKSIEARSAPAYRDFLISSSFPMDYMLAPVFAGDCESLVLVRKKIPADLVRK